MHDFTRRTLLQGGTALAAAGALTGPALFDFAKAWAQTAPWKAEPGAKLTVMRWKRFVPAEDDAFNAMVAAFKAATGTEMNVFSESFEDVQPKASVAANTGSGLDLVWGLHTLPQLFPTKVLKMNDVADYLGKKYGGWTDAAAATCKQGNDWLGIPVATIGGYMTYRKSATRQGRLQGIPEGLPGLPRNVQGAEDEQHAGRLRARPRHRRRQWLAALGPVGSRRLHRRQGRQGHHQLAGNRQGAGILQGAVRHLHSRRRVLERLAPTTRRSWPANSTAPPTASRSMSPPRTIRPRRISPRTPITRCGRSARSASRPNCSSAVPILAFNFTKYPNAAKAFIAFMLEKENFDKWLSGARGYLTHTLNAYDSAPVWTADPKNAVFGQASKRALPASGIGTPGEKAATAIADFLVVDMFANYCTGREDAKGAIAVAERQLKRIYR